MVKVNGVKQLVYSHNNSHIILKTTMTTGDNLF